MIVEARHLRALSIRHPPLNNQRIAAIFLALGHYDTTMLRLGRIFRERLMALRDALNHYRPRAVSIAPGCGLETSYHGTPRFAVFDRAEAAAPVEQYAAAKHRTSILTLSLGCRSAS